MPAIAYVTPSGDTTGATDSAAINREFSAADRDISVQLGPGNWYVNAPLTPGPGNELAGVKGGTNGNSATTPAGTVIHPVPAFSATGGVIDLADGNTANRITDLAILNDLGCPADVDGISCHRNVNGLFLSRVSVCKVSGHAVAYYQGADGTDGDALWMERCMIQRPGKNGVHRPPNDTNVHNVHIQFAGNVAGARQGYGFFSTPSSSGNITYVGCRVDLCAAAGWLIDHKGSYGDATKLIGCSTERNFGDGVLITNSSASGSDWRAPVIISGCCFEGDGMNNGDGGEYAGIEVQGRNRVFIDGTVTAVNTLDMALGAPKYALAIRQAGSSPGRPETIEWASGRLNYSTGQGGKAILNHSQCDQLLIGPTVTQAGGYADDTPDCRAGKATRVAGTAKVSTPWSWPSALISLTPLGYPSGRLYVGSRSDNSFTIKSTSTSDTCDVAWVILPGD
jgi:hypothetical protein